MVLDWVVEFNCNDQRLQTMDIKEFDSGLQGFLTSRLKNNFTFSEVIRIIEDGGVEIVKDGYTTGAEKVFYTLHAQVQNY
ncbi:hypothetical protein OSB04_004936 [Centaurea solstitialis]|uniref:Uncharacterized protein n=1 Tax=Centaurea solstitialis TaxID=347529 RepID=A0AA38WRT4_9ASTR|nr:hypothetical protein OSB04_004936 [Centaurea solstitialis]